jgi:type IV pilus assembly protein PilC
MPVFVWEGKNAEGKVIKGQLEAPNLAMARFALRRQGISVTKISEKKKTLGGYFSFLQGSVKEKELLVFTRQLAAMIGAGVPLTRALDVLQAQQENKYFQEVIQDIKTNVETGSSLADALRKHPKVFDELFINMVAAGETGGVLELALNRVGEYKEKAEALRKKVKGAMVYPVTVLVIAILVVIGLLNFVVPKFAAMFADFGGALPAPTQFVINMSNWLKQNFSYLIGGIMAFFISLKLIKKTEKGQYGFDQLMLKFPIIGELLRKTAVARFCRTLSTMLQSGVPILESLNIVAKTTGNKVLEKIMYQIKDEVSKGQPLAVPMEKAKIFPPLVVQMTAVGEETGELENMLAKVADFFEEEVDAVVEALTSMLEPLMMVFLGGIIGGLMMALYLPIFKLGSVVGG